MAQRPLTVRPVSPEERAELDRLYRRTRNTRLRTRAQMILLAFEQGMVASEIASIVRSCEQTVRNWIRRFNAEGAEGLRDRPRPRALGRPYSLWTLQRLADFMAEETGIRLSHEGVRLVLKAHGIKMSRPQHTISSPDPEYALKKKTIEDCRDHLKAGKVFYYADEFSISWHPTLKAMWTPKGRQIMITTPGQTKKHYGIGAVNYHSGETVVLVRRRKRRKEIAELLEVLLYRHPHETVYVAWDNARTHQDDEIEAIVRGAARRLVLLYLQIGRASCRERV